MSFYLRKSFRMGPVRFNLSKSGFGVSAGVTGARVGLTSQGRPYVHAGRGGVYMRRYLDSKAKTAPRGGFGPTSEPIVLYEDTDVTYAPSADQPDTTLIERLRVRDRAQPAALYLGTSAAGLLVLAGGLAAAATPGVALGTAVAVAGGTLSWRAGSRNRARTRLRRALAEAGVGGVLDDDVIATIRAAADHARLHAEDRAIEYRRAYLEAAIRTVDDGKVEDAELAFLDGLQRLGDIDPGFVRDARRDAFRAAYIAAVADHVLTGEEEQSLDHVRRRLGLAPEDLAPELAVLDRLERLRSIREGKLPVVEPGVPLQQNEVCHFEAPGRLLKEKNLQTFQREGQKYHLRGLVVQREGSLLITDKRILLVYDGTYSVPVSKVLHVEVDVDRNLVQITKDGASTATLFATPDAVLAGAIIAELAGV